ncbi:hypothetical protein HanIR_Chr08g0361771 [Helianthus annuus]|nr:hypothetical protein HanIR_Chr08g0361771 [Helianthus annuus]
MFIIFNVRNLVVLNICLVVLNTGLNLILCMKHNFCFFNSDIRLGIRIRIRNFGYPKIGYPEFRIRISIFTIRKYRISDFRISEKRIIRS